MILRIMKKVKRSGAGRQFSVAGLLEEMLGQGGVAAPSCPSTHRFLSAILKPQATGIALTLPMIAW